MSTLNNIVEEIKECAEAKDMLDAVKDVFGYNKDKDGDFVEFCKKWTYDTPEDNTDSEITYTNPNLAKPRLEENTPRSIM